MRLDAVGIKPAPPYVWLIFIDRGPLGAEIRYGEHAAAPFDIFPAKDSSHHH